MRYILLFTLTLCTFACQPTHPDQNELDEIVARYSEMEGPLVASYVGIPAGLQPISTNKLPYSTIHAQFVDATAGSPDWVTAVTRAESLLERIASNEPDIPYYFLEQSAAINIVGNALLSGKFSEDDFWDEEHLEVLAHYVDILIKNENPQAMIIAPALQRLEGYWPKSRIHEAARITSHATETWVSGNDNDSHLWQVHVFDRLNKEAVADLMVISDS